MNIQDIILVIFIIFFTLLVSISLPSNIFFNNEKKWLYFNIGFLRIIFACLSLKGIIILDSSPIDAVYHEKIGQMLSFYMEGGLWQNVLPYLSPGNRFYQLFQGTLFFIVGCTSYSIVAINAFFSFWGCILLIRVIIEYNNKISYYTDIIILCMPSIIFWTSGNLKEGIMFWTICMIIVFIYTKNRTSYSKILFVIAIVIGGLLRPHIILIWICSILLSIVQTKSIKKIKNKYFVLLLLLIPLQIYLLENLAGLSASIENYDKFTKTKLQIYEMQKDSIGGKSTFLSKNNLPKFFLSGFINIFLRPFPWELYNLRYILSILETYFITSIIFFNFYTKRKLIFKKKNNDIYILGIISIIIFCIFFTNTVNTGLFLRQKIQVFPALFLLFSIRQTTRK